MGSRAMALGAALFIAGLAGTLLRAPQPAAKSPELRALESKPKTVLFIVIDTLRAAHLGCYGGKAAATPVIDAVAARGVRFDGAVCPTPLTRPSITSMMTGRYPARHGVRDNDVAPLDPKIPLAAERIQAAGYRTAAFVSGEPMDRRAGLTRGFSHYDDELSAGQDGGYGHAYGYGYAANVTLKERRAAATLERAAAWLKAQGDAHAFAWIHLFDPHAPYTPPQPEAERYAQSPYAGEVAYVDRRLGIFFEQLRQQGRDVEAQDTVIVITSDHGEGLGEHGEDTHGHFLYDADQRRIALGIAADAAGIAIVQIAAF